MVSSPMVPRQPQSLPRLSVADRLVIFVLLLLPIPTFLGSLAARGADAIRFGAIASRLMLSPRWRWGRHLGRLSFVMLLMFVSGGVSMAYGISHSLRDYLDVLRIAAFWTVFLFGATLAWRTRGQADGAVALGWLMLQIGMLNALFTIGQYAFPDLTRPIQSLYAIGDLRELRMELLSEQGRAFGFFANPNTNAIMLLLLGLPSIAIYQLNKQKWILLCGALVFAAVLLTASRTGLVLAGVALVVLCVASRKLSYLAALLALGGAAYFALDYLVQTDLVRDWFPYLSELLIKVHHMLHGDGFDLASINSFNARLTIWEDSLDWYYLNPALGSGPLREVIPSFADNYYVYLLSRYGALGCGLFVVYMLYVGGLSIAAIRSNRPPQKQWGMVTLAAVVVVSVANYTMDAFLMVPIGSISLLYAGYLTCLMDLARKPRGMACRPVAPAAALHSAYESPRIAR